MLRLLALLFFVALSGETFAANDWVNMLAQDPTGGLVTGHVCYSTNGRDISCDAGAPLVVTSGTLFIPTLSVNSIGAGDINASGQITATAVGATLISATAPTGTVTATNIYGLNISGTAGTFGSLTVNGLVINGQTVTPGTADWYSITNIPVVLQNISNSTGSVTITTVSASSIFGATVSGTNVYGGSVSGTTGTFGSIGVGSINASGIISANTIYVTGTTGTISATYGYFKYVSGTFAGDGSGLINLPAGTPSWYSITNIPTVLQNISNSTGSVTVTTVSATSIFGATVSGTNVYGGSVSGTTGTFGSIGVGTINASGLISATGAAGTVSATYGYFTYISATNGLATTPSWYNITNIPSVIQNISNSTGSVTVTTVSATSIFGATVSGTNVYGGSISGTTGTFGSIGTGSINASGVISATGATGTVSATYGYFKYVSGTFVGDGSGLINLPTASGDRFISGTNTTGMIANSATSIISITNAGITTGYFNSNGVLTAPGISATSNLTSVTTLYASGKVGVGVAAPSDNLHVYANTAGSLGLTVENHNSANGTYARVLLTNDAANTGGLLLGSSGNAGYAGANGLAVGTFNSGALGLYTNNVARLYISSTATLVGIGTSTPSATLDVIGTISATNVNATSTAGTVSATYGYFTYISATNGLGAGTSSGDRITSGTTASATAMIANSATGVISITNLGVGTGYFNSNGVLTAPGISATSNLTSVTTLYASGKATLAGDLAVSTSVLYVSASGGKVGVGTAAPTSTFEVSSTNNQIHITSSGNSGGYLASVNPNNLVLSGGANWNGSNYVAKDTTAAHMILNGGSLLFFTDSGLTAGNTYTPSQRMTINASGNVGVGRTAPIANLDVVGTISASTAIQVGSNALTCATGISGTMRYSAISSTMEYCNGSAWTSMGPSATAPVAFMATLGGSTQTVPANTVTKLHFNTKVFDTNANFDATTNYRFTPTVPGYFLFNLQAHCSDAGIYCAVDIYKNGSVVGTQFNPAGGISNALAATSIILYMNGLTDYVEGFVQNNNGVSINGSGVTTYFSGVMLSPQAGGSGATPAGSSNDVQFNSSGSLGADTGNFTYASSVLKAPTVSSTYSYHQYVSSTQGTFGTIGSGLINATGISITTNQTSVTTLYASGNVGIGTATPPFKLSVVGGPISISSSSFTQTPTSVGQGIFGGGPGNGAQMAGKGTLTDVGLDNRNGENALGVIANTANIFVSGSLGVGTITPAYKLDVSGSGSQLHLSADGLDDGGYLFGISPSNVWLSTGAAVSTSNAAWVAKATTAGIMGGNANGLYFFTDSGLTIGSTFGPTSRMAILTNGKVGVGTGTPNANFEVSGTISATNLVVGGCTGCTGAIAPGGPSGSIQFNLNNSTTSGTAAFTLMNNNVGIGTAAPNAKLDVIGTVSASNVYVTGTTGTVSATYGYFTYISATNGLSGGGGASGDRIVSGTTNQTSLIAVSQTGYISITTSGTTTGYFNPNGVLTVPGISATANLTSVTTLFASGKISVGSTSPGTPRALDVSATGQAAYFGSSVGGLMLQGGTVATIAGLNEGQTANNDIAFTAATANILYLKSSNGYVGVGTATPTMPLEVSGTISATQVSTTNVSVTTSDYTSLTVTTLQGSGGNFIASATTSVSATNASGGSIGFATSSGLVMTVSGTALLINQTAPTLGNEKLAISFPGNLANGLTLNDTFGMNTAGLIRFYSNGTYIGGILNNNNTAVSYNTTSDRRLKENIVDTSMGLGQLMKMQVRDFNFMSDPSKTRVQGFIAQELYEVYPQAVTVGGTNPKEKPWAVDYGHITPLLVKSAQDEQIEIEQLKAENASMKQDFQRQIDQLKAQMNK
jgi:hypothetical protein